MEESHEIKTMLDKMPEYREKLYIRGYLITGNDYSKDI